MMLLLPVLGQAAAEGGVTTLSIITTLTQAILGIVVVFLAARRIVPFLLHHVIRLRNREIFFLLVVLLCMGTAWITYSLGLSLALGAFLSGLIISESEYSHHIVANIMPFRDYFASIFFISIGMLLQTGYFASNWVLVIGMTSALIVTKTVLVIATARVLRYPMRNAVLTGLGLAQIGEFAFLLAQQGAGKGLITGDIYQLFVDTSILSMLVTPLIVQIGPSLIANLPAGPGAARERRRVHAHGPHHYRRIRTERQEPGEDAQGDAYSVRGARGERRHDPQGPGRGRADHLWRHYEGRRFCQGGSGLRKGCRLRHLGLRRHPVGAEAGPANEPSIFILVRTRYAAEVDELLKLGADQVIPEEFETSIEIFSRVLHQYHVPGNVIANQINLVRFRGLPDAPGDPPDQERSAVSPRFSRAPRWTISRSIPRPPAWERP